MIGALLWAGWRERLTRPVLVVLLFVASAAMLAAVFAGTMTDMSEELTSPTLIMTLIFGAGIVGRDVSSGAVALMFTRPIKRWRYLMTRWVGAAVAAATCSVLHLGLQFGLLWRLGKGVPARALMEASFEAVTGAFGLTAVLLVLSTLVPGLGDLAVWIALALLLGIMARVGLPQRIVEQLNQLIDPGLDWATAFQGGTGSWFAVASYASNVTLCLALAVWVMNRKEISYASR